MLYSCYKCLQLTPFTLSSRSKAGKVTGWLHPVEPEPAAQLADRRVILRVCSEKQLHVWAIPLDLVQLTNVIKGHKGHAVFTGDPMRI